MTAIDEDRAPASLRELRLRFLKIFVPLQLAVCGTIAFLYWHNHRNELAVLGINQSDLVVLQNNNLQNSFVSIASDVEALAGAVNKILRGASASEDAKKALVQLGAQFQVFLAQKGGAYEQIRLVDDSGGNILLVRRGQVKKDQDTQSMTASPEELLLLERVKQRKPGELIASGFDFGRDQSDTGRRRRPTIHFATPVFVGAERKLGAIVVDFRGERLLEQLARGTNLIKALSRAQLNVASDVTLLDGAGNRIIGADSQQPSNLAFIPPGGPAGNFAGQFPEAWNRIGSVQEGQYRNQEGMFTFQGLSAVPEVASQRDADASGGSDTPNASSWELVSRVHPDVFAGRRRQMIQGIWRWSALVAILLAVGSWLFAAEMVDRQRAAAGMKRNERRFRQLAEHIEEVFWIATADAEQFIYASPAYELIWGRSLSELYEQPQKWVEAIHPEDRARRAEGFNKVKEKGHFDVEYRILRPDGETRWIGERGFAIRDEEGQVYRVAGIADDTTALRQSQDQVLQSERLAAVGEAMTGLAHESRNALQRSVAGLEMLGKRMQDRPEALELLAEVQKSQYYLHELYEEVRGYARPVKLRGEQVDLGQLLRETWSQLREGRNGQFDQLIEEPTETSLECHADPRSVSQVLRNVLENALAAAEEQAEVRVRWSEAQLDGRPALRVSIRDNGPGLTTEQRRKIFEPFFTTKAEGTGLGMAISKRLVEAHEGEIDLGPSAGRGAEIVITLPRRIT